MADTVAIRSLNDDLTAKLDGAVNLLKDVDITNAYGEAHQITFAQLLEIAGHFKTVNDSIRVVTKTETREYTVALMTADGRVTEVKVSGVLDVVNSSGRTIFRDEFARPVFAAEKTSVLYYVQSDKAVTGLGSV